jgi:hypothetical protein
VPQRAHGVFVIRRETGGDADDRFSIFTADQFRPQHIASRRVLEDIRSMFEELLRTLPSLTESEVRAELTARGFPPDDIEDQLERARNVERLGEGFAWESTTDIGYRNIRQQEVIRKTASPGTQAFQRMYVLQCGDCGYEYETEGREIHRRRCPRCQSI